MRSHMALLRGHQNSPLLGRSKKHVFFTFILHFLLPNLIVRLHIINLIDLLGKLKFYFKKTGPNVPLVRRT